MDITPNMIQSDSKIDLKQIQISCFEDKNEIYNKFWEYGVIHFPNFLKEDEPFNNYLNDLKSIANLIFFKHCKKFSAPDSLEDILSLSFQSNPQANVPLYHLGTQPNQLVSGNKLKSSEKLIKLTTWILGDDAILATPVSGDTLSGFHASKSLDHMVLPIHEDFPYILQSSRQITIWISLSHYHEDLGKLEFWLGSHKHGPHDFIKDKFNRFEAKVSDEQLAQFKHISVKWDFSDLIIMHTHMLHRGQINRSNDKTRLIQIFRYTDLMDPVARNYDWRSNVWDRPGAQEDKIYELYKKNR